MQKKIIKDSIHGFITFEGEAEIAIMELLSDPFFQRLRRVKQLGFSDYVFPSATHTRFSHSLGVYSVAKRILSIVEPKSKNGDWSQKGKACLAAALLHDIGHGMFSHAFEKAMEFFFLNNERSKHSELEKAANHEKISQNIILRSSITKKLISIGGEEFPKLVADIINKTDENCIYTAIISSQLDADRLDYAKRDPYFAGVSSGGIDLDWLISNLHVRENTNSSFLYVDSKAYISLEQFTVTLFQLYPTIYLHKKTRGLEYMFALLISRVFELISQNKESNAGLQSDHPFVKFFREPEKIENIVHLDDSTFFGSLYLFQNAKDSKIKTLSKKIQERETYPLLDVWKIADKIIAQGKHMQSETAQERVDAINKICKLTCDSLKITKGPWTNNYYYDTYDRPIYKPTRSSSGSPQQINIMVGEEIVDIASISPIVASAASFNIHRIYYDGTIENLGNQLEYKIESQIKLELQKRQ